MLFSTWRLIISSVGVLAGLCSCGGASGAPDFDVEVCSAPRHEGDAERCPEEDCGPNSPALNGFPINGLTGDGRGACNPQGVQMLPRSLHGGACGHGADLAMDPTGTRLIGRRGGKVVCTGEELTGAQFTVRSFAHATLTLTIANVRRFQVEGRGDHEGYRIESGGGSACEPGIAERIRRQLGRVEPSGQTSLGAQPEPWLTVAGYEVGPNDDLVIPVDGPLYSSRDQTIPGTRGHWFNLACVGDALAKRTLYDLYTPGDDGKNETALKMVTANYCGKPYTVRGVKFGWTRDYTPNPLEARWAAGKAVCISTPRLMTLKDGGGHLLSLQQLPAALQPRGCESGDCDQTRWINALLAECHLDRCPAASAFEFESYLDEGVGDGVIYRRSKKKKP